jgi:hypothetical protein
MPAERPRWVDGVGPHLGSSARMPHPRISAEGTAHDVLAAEAFAVPAADPALRHDPITLPEDPSGIAEPHDVLAAEEFAMPAMSTAPAPAGPLALARRARPPVGLALAGLVALLALVALRRRRP